eukprot:100477-Ditylum_brightwellii.AAC.1
MEAEGAQSNGCQGASICSKVSVNHSLTSMMVEGVSSSSLKLVDCEVDGNEGHTRSNVKCPGMEESATQTARFPSEGGSNASSTMEDKATSGELATNIGKAEGGGSNAAATTEEKATLWELATNIGKPASDIFMATAEMINSNGGGNIAGSNQAATILNAMGLGVYTDHNEEHLSTRKMSIIGDNCAGESMKIQTPAENNPKSLLLNFKSSNIDLKHESFLHTAMDSLIQDMAINLFSPTSACSTANRNGIVEEDLIVVWKN